MLTTDQTERDSCTNAKKVCRASVEEMKKRESIVSFGELPVYNHQTLPDEFWCVSPKTFFRPLTRA